MASPRHDLSIRAAHSARRAAWACAALSVARSHVRETLRAAEVEGLVRAGQTRGCYLPGLARAPTIGRFFSVVFLIYLHAFVAARAQGWDIGPPRESP